MLRGRWGGSTGRPYFEAILYIPSQDISAELSFLLDTGADTSYLMPGDAKEIGLDRSILSDGYFAKGIGGEMKSYRLPALLVFEDDENVYVYEVDLGVAAEADGLIDTPSLLGRDVINQWDLRYNRSASVIAADPQHASVRMPLPRRSGPRPRSLERD